MSLHVGVTGSRRWVSLGGKNSKQRYGHEAEVAQNCANESQPRLLSLRIV